MSSDPKVRLIENIHGMAGYAIINKILEWVYRDKGYYVVWTEREVGLMSEDTRLEASVIRAIVKTAIAQKFFDFDKWKNHEVLTSEGIQRRYAHGKKKSLEEIGKSIRHHT